MTTSASRHKSRALIVKILYRNEFHTTGLNPFKQREDLFLKDLHPSHKEFILIRLEELSTHKDELDEVINQSAKNWKKERMALVDLNIMRLAAFEILFCEDIPDKVALNEALELAKEFGDKDSSRFINGILDQVIRNKKTKL